MSYGRRYPGGLAGGRGCRHRLRSGSARLRHASGLPSAYRRLAGIGGSLHARRNDARTRNWRTSMIDRDIFEELFVLEMANNHRGSLERALKIVGTFAQVVRFN